MKVTVKDLEKIGGENTPNTVERDHNFLIVKNKMWDNDLVLWIDDEFEQDEKYYYIVHEH